MTYSRHQLADALEAAIAASDTTFTYKVIPDPRSIGAPDPSIDCVLQIVRQNIKRAPANPVGSFEEKHELWLMIPGQDPKDAEDTLDDHVAEVIDFLEAIDIVTWSSAERGVNVTANRHGYKFTLNLTTDRTPE